MKTAAILTGIGTCLPPRLVSNDELAARLDSSDEWITARTGIRQRYVATAGMATSDLAVTAASRALASSGSRSVDAVVLATTTPDQPCPATAPAVASRLGMTGIAAFDVAAVCSGFVYALATAAGLLAAGTAGSALVIGAEVFSSILNPGDRSTSVIFGDGAGAVVLSTGSAREPGAFGPFDLGSDGTGSNLIAIPGGGSRQRLSGLPPVPEDRYFTMAGKTVFLHAVQAMCGSALAVLGRAGWSIADVDWLVCHQANLRITHQVADTLGIPRERSVSNIDRVGNTAAASIPLALGQAHAAGTLRAGDRILLTAFGGGLSWGSTLLTWPSLAPGGPDGEDPQLSSTGMTTK